MINFVYMPLQHSLLQQLLSHFQQCYQYLLSQAKVNNVLQSDTGPEQFSFVLNHLQCMSP